MNIFELLNVVVPVAGALAGTAAMTQRFGWLIGLLGIPLGFITGLVALFVGYFLVVCLLEGPREAVRGFFGFVTRKRSRRP